METRALETKMETTQNRTIRGYALKWGTRSNDLGGFVETLEPESLAKTDLTDVRAFIDHEPSKIIGRTTSGTLRLDVNDIGLRFEVDVPKTSYGDDLLEMVNRGDITGCSFGMVVPDGGAKWTKENGTYLRSITEISRLWEISIVTMPAYEDTNVEVAKRELSDEKTREASDILFLELELLELDI